MKLPLKKEEPFESEKILKAKEQQRRFNLSQEIPWIEQQQKVARTKGFVNFDKQLVRTDFAVHSNRIYASAHEDRFWEKQIPSLYSKYSNAGRGLIPYKKQLPRHTQISMSQFTTIGDTDHKYASCSRLRNSYVLEPEELESDNIDTLAKTWSKNKLAKLFHRKSALNLQKESPERANLNEKLNDVLLPPKDRFTISPPKKNDGYMIDYKKQQDRFPKGINIFNPKGSYFQPTDFDKLEIIDKAIRGSRNITFKIRKDKFYHKVKQSNLPRHLLCTGERNELDLLMSENSMKHNNYSNCNFYINPIGRPNNKQRLQEMWAKHDIRTLLMKQGYLKNFDDIKSPVKEYIQEKKNLFGQIIDVYNLPPPID